MRSDLDLFHQEYFALVPDFQGITLCWYYWQYRKFILRATSVCAVVKISSKAKLLLDVSPSHLQPDENYAFLHLSYSP